MANKEIILLEKKRLDDIFTSDESSSNFADELELDYFTNDSNDSLESLNPQNTSPSAGIKEESTAIRCPSCGHRYDLPYNTTAFICVHCFNRYSVIKDDSVKELKLELASSPQNQAVQEKKQPWYIRLLQNKWF